MTVHEFAQQLSLQTVCEPDPEREITGGYVGDLLSWVMGNASSGDVWVTIMSNRNIVAVASLADTAAVVLTENVSPDAGVAELAEQRGINLYTSTLDSFRVCAELSKRL